MPAAVQARVRRTTALGEKFIDLVPIDGGGDQLLASGATIASTSVVSDLEQLVGEGGTECAERLPRALQGLQHQGGAVAEVPPQSGVVELVGDGGTHPGPGGEGGHGGRSARPPHRR